MKIAPLALLHKLNLVMLAVLKPLGVWGVCALAIVDSSSIPMPIDAIVIGYVSADRGRFVIYALMAALGSAIGALVPYYLGRAGGELFLLKRINRQRYEKLRDRFERQEFLAIMIPAMMPPPMPVKLFELAAGVFEMKPVWFFSAIFLGKFLRFMLWAAITVFFGPAIVHTVTHTFHEHTELVLAISGILAVFLAVYIARKIFDRRRGTPLPIEDEEVS
ncbi:MAG TPA: VTT domain-containing protein [Granulicella sp.]|nr:VTT domain-containing protein [Granulicella sp.]